MTRAISLLLRYRMITAIILFGVSMLFIAQLKNIQIKNDYSIWFSENDKAFNTYRKFVETFGDDENVILLYKSDSIFHNSGILFNRSLTDELLKINGVANVTSLATAKKIVQRPFGFSLSPILPNETKSSEKLQEFVASHPIYGDYLVFNDGNSTALIISLESKKERALVYQKVREIKERFSTADFEIVLYGSVPIKVAIEDLSRNETMKFVFVAIVLIGALLFVVFRSLVIIILPLLTAVLSGIWTLGLMALTGVTLNMVLTILPLILLLISIAFTIHLLSALSSHNKSNKVQNIIDSLKSVFPASAISGITTMIAFSSFAFSKISPISDFGIYAAIGVFFCLLISFTVIPILFSYYLPFLPNRKAKWTQIYEKLIIFQKRRWKVIVISCITLAILSIWGIFQLEINTDQSKYFSENHEVRIQLNQAEKLANSIYPIEMVVNFSQSIYRSPEKYLKHIEEFENDVGHINQVTKGSVFSSSLTYYVKAFNYKYSKEQLVKLLRSSQIKAGENFIDPSGEYLRLTIRTPWIGAKETKNIVSKIKEVSKKLESNTNATLEITGLVVLFNNLSSSIVSNQIISISFSFLLISIVFLIIFRSLIITLLALIPNILPIIISLGIMGWTNTPLDVVTSLLATITLGIAVDDTIHFLKSYQKHIRSNTIEGAIMKSYNYCGKAIIITTLLIVCGFAAMMFSDYRPILHLGVFIAISISLALILDLILLPILIRQFKIV